jgi:signal transduction histidine kinase
MIRLQEEERSRVSRELHDELGQMLTALKFDVVWIERYLPDANSSLKTRYKAMCCLIDDSLDRIREISAGLRPGILDDMGLTAAIEWYTSEFQRRSDVECVVLLDLPEKRLQDHIETGIYRIVQEALTNVARHAKASVVTVRIKEDTGTIFLQIADNGTGIDAAKVQSPLSTGISGIQERAEILSATLQIKGIPGKGTQINLRIPAR